MGKPKGPKTFNATKPKPDPQIQKILSSTAFPIQLMSGDAGLGMNKFEFYSATMLGHLLANQRFETDDSELLAIARRAVRSAKALFQAQIEAFNEQAERLKVEAEKKSE